MDGEEGVPDARGLEHVEVLPQLDVLRELVEAIGGRRNFGVGGAGRLGRRGSRPRYFSTAATSCRVVSSSGSTSSGNRPPNFSSSEATNLHPLQRIHARLDDRRVERHAVGPFFGHAANLVEHQLRQAVVRSPGRAAAGRCSLAARSGGGGSPSGLGRAASGARARFLGGRAAASAAVRRRVQGSARLCRPEAVPLAADAAIARPRRACRPDSRRGRRAAGSCRWRSSARCPAGSARSHPAPTRARRPRPGESRRTCRGSPTACAARLPGQ